MSKVIFISIFLFAIATPVSSVHAQNNENDDPDKKFTLPYIFKTDLAAPLINTIQFSAESIAGKRSYEFGLGYIINPFIPDNYCPLGKSKIKGFRLTAGLKFFLNNLRERTDGDSRRFKSGTFFEPKVQLNQFKIKDMLLHYSGVYNGYAMPTTYSYYKYADKKARSLTLGMDFGHMHVFFDHFVLQYNVGINLSFLIKEDNIIKNTTNPGNYFEYNGYVEESNATFPYPTVFSGFILEKRLPVSVSGNVMVGYMF